MFIKILRNFQNNKELSKFPKGADFIYLFYLVKFFVDNLINCEKIEY